MRICFLASANSAHSYRWIKYFVKGGHEIHWISNTPLNFKNLVNVHYYELQKYSSKVLSFLCAVKKIKKLIKEMEPNILHSHYAGTNGLMGALTKFHPHIVTAWGSDILIAGRSMIKRPMIRYVLNQADIITCDANHMKEAMLKLGVNDKKIKLIYFGVEIDKYQIRKGGIHLREKWGLANQPIIISLRTLEPIYDVETLILSIPYILKDVPEAKFIIAGRGPEEGKLKHLAKSLGVMESINFVGYIPSEEIPQYLESSDIYVSTSLSDAGIAASTAEAMASGLPVIITNSGENRLWVQDGESGFIIPIKNPILLADKILYLLKVDDARIKFGQAGRKIIEEKNNYYKEMEKMENIYKEVMGPHEQARGCRKNHTRLSP
jgi:glycosyltransferase involved in cell wall biosynthesis